MWCDVAKDSNCWGAGTPISRVKHVLEGQNVGDLELSEPIWLHCSGVPVVTVEHTLGTVGWFPAPTR